MRFCVRSFICALAAVFVSIMSETKSWRTEIEWLAPLFSHIGPKKLEDRTKRGVRLEEFGVRLFLIIYSEFWNQRWRRIKIEGSNLHLKETKANASQLVLQPINIYDSKRAFSSSFFLSQSPVLKRNSLFCFRFATFGGGSLFGNDLIISVLM